MLLAFDLHEDFINVEGISIAPVLSFQTAGIYYSELDAEPAPLRQENLIHFFNLLPKVWLEHPTMGAHSWTGVGGS
jgi:hypothetical protein